MKRPKLKNEIFSGSFFAKIEMCISKDDDGVEKISLWLETGKPITLVKAKVAAGATTKKRKKRVDK